MDLGACPQKSTKVTKGRLQSLPSGSSGSFCHMGTRIPNTPQEEHELPTITIEECYDNSSQAPSRQDGNETTQLEGSVSFSPEPTDRPAHTTTRSARRYRVHSLRLQRLSFARWTRCILAILKLSSIIYINVDLERDDLFLFDILTIICVILRDLSGVIDPIGGHSKSSSSISVVSDGILFAALLALLSFDVSLVVKFYSDIYSHINEVNYYFKYGPWKMSGAYYSKVIMRNLLLAASSWVLLVILSTIIMYYVVGAQVQFNRSHKHEHILFVTESGELQGAICHPA
ncbi:hypothetical protein ANO14919_127740 [Xylariales sp. No.14919]|nr:hypothetical protein ANO14919_127740 [Xylariales sp. No.14919]